MVPLVLVAMMLVATALGWWVVTVVLALAAVGSWTSLAAHGRVGAPLVDSTDAESDSTAHDRTRLSGMGM